MQSIAEKFLGKPARACPACGSTRAYIPPTGGLRCRTCRPPDGTPAVELIATPDGSVQRWQVFNPDDQFGEPSNDPTPQPSNEAENPSRSNTATYDATRDESLPDRAPHTCDVFVSSQLNWRVEPVGEFAEIFEPDETYRKLDERYFGWLYGKVMSLPESSRDEAVRLLMRICCEGLNAGVLPASFVSRNQWPTFAPATYIGPLLFAEHCKFFGLPE